VLIIRRSKLYYIASGIITPIGGLLVHRLTEATYRCDDTRGSVMQFWPPDDEHMCSKHVDAGNKLIVKQKICALSWLITEINILKCAVSKTSKNSPNLFSANNYHTCAHFRQTMCNYWDILICSRSPYVIVEYSIIMNWILSSGFPTEVPRVSHLTFFDVAILLLLW